MLCWATPVSNFVYINIDTIVIFTFYAAEVLITVIKLFMICIGYNVCATIKRSLMKIQCQLSWWIVYRKILNILKKDAIGADISEKITEFWVLHMPEGHIHWCGYQFIIEKLPSNKLGIWLFQIYPPSKQKYRR